MVHNMPVFVRSSFDKPDIEIVLPHHLVGETRLLVFGAQPADEPALFLRRALLIERDQPGDSTMAELVRSTLSS